MANEVVMSPVYRGVVEAIALMDQYHAALYGDEASRAHFAYVALQTIREAVEDRVDAIVTGRGGSANLNKLFEPTSIEFDPTEVVG